MISIDKLVAKASRAQVRSIGATPPPKPQVSGRVLPDLTKPDIVANARVSDYGYVRPSRETMESVARVVADTVRLKTEGQRIIDERPLGCPVPLDEPKSIHDPVPPPKHRFERPYANRTRSLKVDWLDEPMHEVRPSGNPLPSQLEGYRETPRPAPKPGKRPGGMTLDSYLRK